MGGVTRVDLHCHSNRSDGAHPPEKVAEGLAAAGVRLAALTDHDTISGLGRFEEALARRGVECVSGVEISVGHPAGMVHLLAYGFNPDYLPFLKALRSIRNGWEQAARILMDDIKRVWHRVWAMDLPRHLLPVSVADVTALIHEAGGLAFLAHPLSVSADTVELDIMLGELKEEGLDGIEALYKPYPKDARRVLLEMANRHGLLVSFGSDVHDFGGEDSEPPGVDVPDDLVDAFRDALKTRTNGHARGHGQERRR